MNKKDIKLYNLIFPIWFLLFLPYSWIVVLPANFLIDLTVTAVAMKCFKIDSIKQKVKSVILKVWIFGFAADFIGAAFMFASNIIEFGDNTTLNKWWYTNIISAVNYTPFKSIYGALWVAVCVIITAVFIYIFNYKICLKTLDIDADQKKKIALTLAICTAPYLFFIPTAWFYYS